MASTVIRSTGLGGADTDATDYADFLDILRTEAVATGDWTVLENTSDKVVLQGIGDGTQEIIIAFQKYADVPSDAYGLHINGYTGYNSGLTFFNQPGANPNYYSLPLDNGPIAYCFVISPRRITIVAKVASTYQMAYAGFYLPYASPGQFPYPMMIGGSYYGSAAPRYSGLTAAASAFWAGRNNGSSKANYSLRIPSGEWRSDYNTYSVVNAFSGVPYANQNVAGVWPYFTTDGYFYPTSLAYQLRGTVDGEAVAFPLEFWLGGNSGATYKGIAGEIDGIFFVSGALFDGPESIITIDGDDYLAVPDVFRTGIDNFCAVRLT